MNKTIDNKEVDRESNVQFLNITDSDIKNRIIQGNCLDVLKTLEGNSIDAVVTDPPYEIGFMGKKWDSTGIAYNVELWKECLRVLKPGGHLLAFGGTRTYHRMACAIEDAGFEIRDQIQWIYGSGFPKSFNIGKAVDKLQGNEGKTEWEGWGTALKPANEPIVLARKPLSEKTVAENCLKWGVGGINIDESRVENTGKSTLRPLGKSAYQKGGGIVNGGVAGTHKVENEFGGGHELGRFPANVIHDGSDEVAILFPNTKSGKMGANHTRHTDGSPNGIYGKFNINHPLGETYGDSGSASRFFYCAKASKKERNMGCENMDIPEYRWNNAGVCQQIKGRKGNFHPTVKPLKLMEYLVKLVSRENATVLDPFAGSGSTLIACKNLNRNYIGIEIDPEYIKIIKARLNEL
jgi:DNA modification methylase